MEREEDAAKVIHKFEDVHTITLMIKKYTIFL